MQNLQEWKELINETMKEPEIVHSDKVSIFIKHKSGYVVIENEGASGLQLQFRKTLDPSDIVMAEDIIVHNKIVSALASTNHNDVKKIFGEFVDKL